MVCCDLSLASSFGVFAERSAAGKNGALEKEQGKPYTFLTVKDKNIIEILI